MDRRIETRVIDTAEGTKLTALIQKDACQIWWMTISVQEPGTRGLIKIYDGFDAQGKLVWQVEPEYAGLAPFIPPIPCDMGIYIVNDAGIASYTIGYRPKGWPREQK